MFLPAYGYYDVTTYFHTGDPDWTAAIQRAENACETTGGVVYFPPGTYLISAKVTVSASNVTWQGAGAGASVIELDTSAGTVTQIVQVSAGLANIAIIDLGFRGNGLNNGAGGAPGADAIQIGTVSGGVNSYCAVLNCKFFNTTCGATVHFYNATDAEVSGCHFDQVGFDNGTTGDANITPAIYVDVDCIAVRIRNNYFTQCFYDGIRIAGTACEAVSNYAIDCKASGIDTGVAPGNGDGTRLFGNYIDSTHQITTSNQGIYVQTIRNFQLVGNTVAHTDNDGIAGGECSSGAYIGNVLFDNGVVHGTAGLEGLQYIAQKKGANPNKGITFVGNISCDQSSPPTQENGFRMFGGKDNLTATDFVLVANAFFNNPTAGINIDNVILNDNSDVAITNGSWLDRQHEKSQTLTATTLKSPLVLSNPSIDPFSMETFNGLRITASGQTKSGTMPNSRTFYLGLGVSGNLMSGFTVGSSDGDWQLEAYVLNDRAFGAQRGFVHFWYAGNLVYHSGVNTSVTTSSQANVLLEGQLGNGGDSIVTDLLVVERI